MTDQRGPERRGADRVRVATVLVVDDSSTIRRILRRDLEAAGYRVVEADNGEVGLAACRALRPDLVLLDVDMPVLDGMATLERMQADPDLRHLPVLFLTAPSRDRAGGAARRPEPRGDDGENRVAHDVALRVVHVLEVIQVSEKHRHGALTG